MTKIKKELLRFLIAGFSAVGTDMVTYYLLLKILDPDLSKGISFLLGTIVAFFINKYWTFERTEKSMGEVIKFGVLYGLTFWANVLTNKLILDQTQIVIVAFIIATGVSTVLNFVGQKWWVFK